ncbi:MAG: rhodanese-like domain-containing protein [Acidobacteriaceae bacterium]|nr:rhodanese-like domain-containing protein [Acidobacteriaceae bacterium]
MYQSTESASGNSSDGDGSGGRLTPRVGSGELVQNGPPINPAAKRIGGRHHTLRTSIPLEDELTEQPSFLDLRPPSLFARGFIPGSINLVRLDCFALLAGIREWTDGKFYVIAGSAVDRQVARRSFQRSFPTRAAGWLTPDVVRQWSRTRGQLGSFKELEPEALAALAAASETVMIDVRDEKDFSAAHVPDSLNVPVSRLRTSLSEIPFEKSLSVLCESGKYSTFAASQLWNLGYRNLSVVRGGFQAYAKRGLPVTRL